MSGPTTISSGGRASALATALLLLLPALAACGNAIVDPEATIEPTTATTGTVSVASPSPTAAASGTATPTASPTPRPDATLDAGGLPADAVGPLLLYRAVIEDALSFGLGSPSPEVVVYDVGAGRELIRIWIGNPGRQPQASFIVGPYVIVNFGDAVWRYALDGTRDLLIDAPENTVITALAADSPGGVAVVATQTRLGGPARWHWIDVDTSTVLRETDPIAFNGLGDPLPRIVARADQDALLRGVTYSDQPGGYAVLEASGSVRDLSVSGFVAASPDGRFVAHGPQAICDNIGGPTIEITAVGSNEVVASYSDPSVSLAPWDWSPDGTEIAIQVRALRADDACPNAQLEPDWLTLSIDGTIREVASGVSLRDEWYGRRAITFRCANQVDPGWYSRRDGLQRPSACLRFDVEIQVGTEPIALEPTATILGFIDLD